MRSDFLKSQAGAICDQIDAYLVAQEEEYIAGPGETLLLAYLQVLAKICKRGAEGDKEDAWYDEALTYWKTNATAFPDSPAQPFVERLLNIFNLKFSAWVENKYGKENFNYVSNTQDNEAIATVIVPYLRQRSQGKSTVALEVWREIVSNFFLSNIQKWERVPPSIKEISYSLRELEIQPMGAADKPTLYGDEKRVVDTFLQHKPTGFYSARHAKAILDVASSVEDAVDGISWMFSDEVTDDFLKTNRPYTLGYIARMWHHYDAYKANKPDPAKQEEAKRKLKATLSKIV